MVWNPGSKATSSEKNLIDHVYNNRESLKKNEDFKKWYGSNKEFQNKYQNHLQSINPKPITSQPTNNQKATLENGGVYTKPKDNPVVNPNPNPNPTVAQPSSNDISHREKMTTRVNNQSDSYYKNQKAKIDQSRQRKITEIKTAYEDAVANGKMSIREAEQAYKERAEQINQQSYRDSERTNLMAQNRGIQNSQQMMGMVASDNSRKNNLINESMSQRDMRVSNIKDRINSLNKQKDLNISSINSESDLGLLGARARADQMAANQLFNLDQNMYNLNRNEDFQRAMAQLQHSNQLELQGSNQDFQKEFANQQNQFDMEKLLKSQEFQEYLTKQGWDFQEKMQNDNQQFQKNSQEDNQAFNKNMTLMSHANNFAMQNMQNEFAWNTMNANNAFQMQFANNQNQHDWKKLMQSQEFQQYMTEQGWDFQQNIQDDQQKHEVGMQNDQQAYDEEKLKAIQDFDWKKFEKGLTHDITKMELGHDLNMETLDKKFDQELEAMAKQFGYSSSLQSQRASSAMAQVKAKMKAEVQAEQQAYLTAVERESAKYEPGTEEYNIRMNQLKDERDTSIAGIHSKTLYEATSQSVLGGQTTMPEPPSYDWNDHLFGGSGAKKKDAEYDAKLNSYNRYLDFMDDGKINGSQEKEVIMSPYNP